MKKKSRLKITYDETGEILEISVKESSFDSMDSNGCFLPVLLVISPVLTLLSFVIFKDSGLRNVMTILFASFSGLCLLTWGWLAFTRRVLIITKSGFKSTFFGKVKSEYLWKDVFEIHYESGFEDKGYEWDNGQMIFYTNGKGAKSNRLIPLPKQSYRLSLTKEDAETIKAFVPVPFNPQ